MSHSNTLHNTVEPDDSDSGSYLDSEEEDPPSSQDSDDSEESSDVSNDNVNHVKIMTTNRRNVNRKNMAKNLNENSGNISQSPINAQSPFLFTKDAPSSSKSGSKKGQTIPLTDAADCSSLTLQERIDKHPSSVELWEHVIAKMGFNSRWCFYHTWICSCCSIFTLGYANVVSTIRFNGFVTLVGANLVQFCRKMIGDPTFDVPQSALWYLLVMSCYGCGNLSFKLINDLTVKPIMWGSVLWFIAIVGYNYRDLGLGNNYLIQLEFPDQAKQGTEPLKDQKPIPKITEYKYWILPLMSYALALQDTMIKSSLIGSLSSADFVSVFHNLFHQLSGYMARNLFAGISKEEIEEEMANQRAIEDAEKKNRN